jgi:hypothetical protein
MRTMFNGLATNEWIRRQCDGDHDARCECGLKETQEHIICECTTKDEGGAESAEGGGDGGG